MPQAMATASARGLTEPAGRRGCVFLLSTRKSAMTNDRNRRTYKKWGLVAILLLACAAATVLEASPGPAAAARHPNGTVAAGLAAQAPSGTLIVTGSSENIVTYLGWLETFTCKDLGIDSEGRLILVAEAIEGCTVRSAHLRQTVNAILMSTAAIHMTLVENDGNIFYDGFNLDIGGAFTEGQPDTADIGGLPDPPVPPNTSNDWNKAQQIAHHLDEYFHAVRTGQGYAQSHQAGIASENSVRSDSGALGSRVADGVTWQVTASGTLTKSWFTPDPTNPANKFEVYREEVDQVGGTARVIGRTKTPPGPKNCVDPEPGEVLIFQGRIVSVSEPSLPVWSGEAANVQVVVYDVLSTLKGTPGPQVRVKTPVVFGTPEADPLAPRLDPEIFTIGATRVVEAEFLRGCIDPATGQPPLWDVAVGRKRPVGGIAVDLSRDELPLEKPDSSSDNIALSAFIGAVMTGVVALGGAAWYATRRRRQ